MLYRKIEALIKSHLLSDSAKILLIDGARQVGKTYIVRHVGKELFDNFIEVNMVEDSLGERLFANIKSVEDFYLQLSMIAGNKMKSKENTLIFIDEIQAYPHLLTLLKFLSQDNKFTYIASGSLLGVTLSQTTSIPMGSIRKVRMFPLDFEEFLYANGMNEIAISAMQKKFERLESLDESTHNKMMDLFRKYLLVGGLPDAVNSYISERNIQSVREIQREIHEYYGTDASKYDEENKKDRCGKGSPHLQRSFMKKKDTLEDLVNNSITQTLSRSVFTSLTTFVMVAALYVLGVTSIKEFALPLMVGILCGTYSSVCITGALWLILRKVFPQKVEE